MPKVLMIIGSLRKGSFNRRMAGEIQKLIGDRADVTILEYADIPYMNQDIEFPAPAEVARVRKEVQDADALWICTPEYNGNIPGVLKNLLDWLSRPLAPNDRNSVSVARGKKVTISGAAGKSAAAGVRGILSGLLTSMRMDLIVGEGVGISLSGDAFATGEYTFTEENIAALKQQADAFLAQLS